jgi:hypothetical protein
LAPALRWFGDPNPDGGSPWEKGQRLAGLLQRQRTLLILDGLEPLQHPPPGDRQGRLQDEGMRSLLRALAVNNPGLCVVSTRIEVDDLKDFEGVRTVKLTELSKDAGIELLEHLGVHGSVAELKKAVSEYGGHALALALLGEYLKHACAGDVMAGDSLPPVPAETKAGGHARRVLLSYKHWFKDKPELDLLRCLGLFDRPADSKAIAQLRAAPPIEGLTDRLQTLSNRGYLFVVQNLRAAGLLHPPESENPGLLDCHPLVRAFFADEVKSHSVDAWCRFSRSSTGCFSRMFVMGWTRFLDLEGTVIGEGAMV